MSNNVIKKIVIFTDGSSSVFKDKSKNKYGGIGVYSNTITFSKGYKGADVTNQTMELTACIEALSKCVNDNDIGKDITVYSDSEYLIKSMTVWAKSWIKKDWKRMVKNKLEEIANVKLIKELYRLTIKYSVKYIHVYSHKNEPRDKESDEWVIWYGNDIADKLASEAMKKIRYESQSNYDNNPKTSGFANLIHKNNTHEKQSIPVIKTKHVSPVSPIIKSKKVVPKSIKNNIRTKLKKPIKFNYNLSDNQNIFGE